MPLESAPRNRVENPGTPAGWRRAVANWLDPRDESAASAASTALPEGFLPISQPRPEDVFVVGYPKSGNTWVAGLLVGAVYGLDLELTPQSLVNDLVPAVHSKSFYKPYLSPVFFKSHALPTPSYRRVIYLLRDGRDAMVSYKHYLEAVRNAPIDFLALVETGENLFPCKWHQHVQQWLANPYHSDMIVVRYEELQADPVGQLERMCEFAGVSRERAVLERAARKASFASMQRRERRLGWDDQRWPRDKAFVRRGRVGSFSDEMPPLVQEAFWRDAGPLLQQLGYASLPASETQPEEQIVTAS